MQTESEFEAITTNDRKLVNKSFQSDDKEILPDNIDESNLQEDDINEFILEN